MSVRQRLGQFEACMVVVGDDSGNRANFFKDRKAAVHARLGEVAIGFEDLGDRHGPARFVEHVDHSATTRRVTVVASAEKACHLVMPQFSVHWRRR